MSLDVTIIVSCKTSFKEYGYATWVTTDVCFILVGNLWIMDMKIDTNVSQIFWIEIPGIKMIKYVWI